MPAATGLRAMLLVPVLWVSCLVVETTPVHGIEMFTYFGDGSRIGLPSLEVPIEAYPGIPLRSDRIRARRAGQPVPQGTIGRFRGRGITIRVPAPPPTAAATTHGAQPSGAQPSGAAAATTVVDMSGGVMTAAALSEETQKTDSTNGEALDLSGFRSFDRDMPGEPGT